jgi:hypothetical protein
LRVEWGKRLTIVLGWSGQFESPVTVELPLLSSLASLANIDHSFGHLDW